MEQYSNTENLAESKSCKPIHNETGVPLTAYELSMGGQLLLLLRRENFNNIYKKAESKPYEPTDSRSQRGDPVTAYGYALSQQRLDMMIISKGYNERIERIEDKALAESQAYIIDDIIKAQRNLEKIENRDEAKKGLIDAAMYSFGSAGMGLAAIAIDSPILFGTVAGAYAAGAALTCLDAAKLYFKKPSKVEFDEDGDVM